MQEVISSEDIVTQNMRLTEELRLREMQIRQLSHECLSEAINILRKLMHRPDCDIPGESWLMLAVRTMENRQREIAERQFTVLAGEDVV